MSPRRDRRRDQAGLPPAGPRAAPRRQPATRRPRRGSRRSPAPTRCCPTPSGASATTTFGPEGAAPARGGDPFGFGGGLGDIFDAFFGGGSPLRRRPAGPAGPPRGQRPRGRRRPRLRAGGVRRASAPVDGAHRGRRATTCEATGAAPGHRRRRRAPSAAARARCAGCASRSSARWSPPAPCPRCGGARPGRSQRRAPTAGARAGAIEEQHLHRRRARRRRHRLDAAAHRPRRGGPARRRRRRPLRPPAGRARTTASSATATTSSTSCTCRSPRPRSAPTCPSRPSTATRTSSIPRGTQTGRRVPAARPGRAPRRGPRPGRPARAGRRSTRPTDARAPSEEELLRQLAELRGEEVAPADTGFFVQDPLGVQVDGAVAAGRRRAAHTSSSTTSTRPCSPTDDRHHLERVLRLRPGDDADRVRRRGRLAAVPVRRRARARRRRRASSRAPDAADHRRLRAGEGRAARVVVQKLTELGVDRDRAVRRRRARSCAGTTAKAAAQRRAAAAGGARGGDAEPAALAARGRRRRRPSPTSPRCPARPLADRGGGPPTLGTPDRARRARGRLDATRSAAAACPRSASGRTVLRAETAAIAAGALLGGAASRARRGADRR